MAIRSTTKNPRPSFYKRRKEIRRSLFLIRKIEQDNTEARLFNDAKLLDGKLQAEGYHLEYITEWARGRDDKQPRARKPRPLQVDEVDLSTMVGA